MRRLVFEARKSLAGHVTSRSMESVCSSPFCHKTIRPPRSASVHVNSGEPRGLIGPVLSLCLAERSDGGDCHLGTAHSNTTQGTYLLSSPRLCRSVSQSPLVSVCTPPVLLFVSPSLPPPPPSLRFASLPIFRILSRRKPCFAVYTAAGGTLEISQSHSPPRFFFLAAESK